MLWAEDLLLLLTDRRTGRLVVPWTRTDLALAGSVLDQLRHTGRIEVDRPDRVRRPGRIRVLAPSPTGDAVLDRVLAELDGADRRPIAAIHRIKGGLRRELYERLVTAGALSQGIGRVLGFVPVEVWPARDPDLQAPFIGRLASRWTSPGLREVTTDPECASATALLGAIGSIGRVARATGLSGQVRQIQRTAARLRQESWVAWAVHSIVSAQQASATNP